MRKETGLTLIELMVVIGIVGILASIATANYNKFVAKARQAEAKIALSAIYTAEVSFYAEKASYSESLRCLGYAPMGGKRFYLTGFWGADPTVCGPGGNQTCYATQWNPLLICDCTCPQFALDQDNCAFPANTKASGAALLLNTCANGTAAGAPAAWMPSKDAFTAGAIGNISPSNTYDIWQINERKEVVNTQSGI